MVFSKVLLAGMCLSLLFHVAPSRATGLNPAEIRQLVQSFKADDRGPYQAIRWFCPDGSVIPAKERCGEPGGIQHALPKESVQKLGDEQHLFLGQILAGTPFADFLDASHNYSRLKQYQLEKYLQAVDNGWILRKARYYRGAMQAEDEEAWGDGFLRYLLDDENLYKEKFFLLREAVRDIPHHGAHADRWRQVRAEAKAIAEKVPAFAGLRVKLHGQPERDDVARIERFLEQHRNELTPESAGEVEKLLAELKDIYSTGGLTTLFSYAADLYEGSRLLPLLKKLQEINAQPSGEEPLAELHILADLLWQSRLELDYTLWPLRRLFLLDLSLATEDAVLRLRENWQVRNIGELYEKFGLLAKAAAGAGYLEIWERREGSELLQPFAGEGASLADLQAAAGAGRRLLNWATAMEGAEFGTTEKFFAGFEPKAAGFIDDRIRSSLLLLLGETAGRLDEFLARLDNRTNQVLTLQGQEDIRGINPGIALGPLRLAGAAGEKTQYDPTAIYLLPKPPADLDPVAGLLCAEEGNLVSHVQLLARNLGIPNSTLSPLHLEELGRFAGKSFFYAVSPGGRVILKPAAEMNDREKALFAERRGGRERIEIPSRAPDLSRTSLIGLGQLRASDAGRICGPKAANLGELKKFFPDQVVNGLVIPFGVFRRHLDQPMPGKEVSYWQYLLDTFSVKGKNDDGKEQGEQRVLKRLAVLRQAIGRIAFLPGFLDELQKGMERETGRPLGKIGVFVRSDTNMEDLPGFTGAGLNLTVFNVVGADAVLQAIRDVWASPYSERSYLWRQKYMDEPWRIYPSVLLLPSVAVDKSGVLITTGISSGSPYDSTVAFSRGAGGAVAGQAAESYLLRASGGNLLLQPSRELSYTVLPASGGSALHYTSLATPILAEGELAELRRAAAAIREKLPAAMGLGSNTPLDVELGFKGEKLWLFQVRPFNENRLARSSIYLKAMDVVSGQDRIIEQDLPLSFSKELHR